MVKRYKAVFNENFQQWDVQDAYYSYQTLASFANKAEAFEFRDSVNNECAMGFFAELNRLEVPGGGDD